MKTVSFQSVAKSFGAVEVLKDINLDVREGEFMVLVGPSGCGKSTLLRLLAGLESVSGGRVFISGRDVTRLEPRDRDIAMVFQSYALYPHRTVEGNMRFALKLAGLPEAEIREKVARAADILGLNELLGRYPRQLSGGQRQRVAMGRAIVRNPAVFLFDEPLSNLDAALRVQMRGEIRSLQKRLGTTTVYVTHDQIEAMTMADRICVLRAGHIEQIGTPLELYDRPANRFVAGFIGSPAMNFLPARIENGQVLLPEDIASIDLGTVYGADTFGNRDVILGIRPDRAHLADEGGLAFRVTLAEPTGSETHLHGSVAGTEATFVLRDRIAPASGDVLHLQPEIGTLHLFDPQSDVCLTSQSGRRDAQAA